MIFGALSMNYDMINLFFAFSFLGWVMEVIVIKRETGKLENRGFASTPFCIIYGFGVMAGYQVLAPLTGHFVALYIIGALGATAFEYIVGRAMIKTFGKLWWDYSEKPLNYQGIICLESTIGWGFGAVLVVNYIYGFMEGAIVGIPDEISACLAVTLTTTYTLDFVLKSCRELKQRRLGETTEYEELSEAA
ncbi:MAG TPA: putative ABC transporter permease [Anaerovoracaceae bacterium]|nr:putative ABC transporter permease [Anaerovoracaceae bacterium]